MKVFYRGHQGKKLEPLSLASFLRVGPDFHERQEREYLTETNHKDRLTKKNIFQP
jgi:hypothetical protein